MKTKNKFLFNNLMLACYIFCSFIFTLVFALIGIFACAYMVSEHHNISFTLYIMFAYIISFCLFNFYLWCEYFSLIQKERK